MIDQYPFEGYTDQWPETRVTPEWFGLGTRNYELRTSPIRHIIYGDGEREAIITIRHDEPDTSVRRQIIDKMRGKDAEQPKLRIAVGTSFNRTPGNGHYGDPQFVFPDTRPIRRRLPGGSNAG